MTRVLSLIAVLAMALTAPSGALADSPGKSGKKPSGKAKVLRAKLAPAQQDVADYTAFRGKAQFVANKRRAKVSIHLKGMVPGATYPWAVVAGDCAGTAVEGFAYKPLRAGDSGNANAKGTAKAGFAYDAAGTYSVVVYQAGTTEPLLCGELKSKAKKAKKDEAGAKKGESKAKSKAKAKGKSKAKAKNKAKNKAKGESKANNKAKGESKANNKAKAKSKGKGKGKDRTDDSAAQPVEAQQQAPVSVPEAQETPVEDEASGKGGKGNGRGPKA